MKPFKKDDKKSKSSSKVDGAHKPASNGFKRHHDDDEEEENEEKTKDHEEEDDDFKVHKKYDRNGFNQKPHANSSEDDANHSLLKEMSLDVKSKEAAEYGDFSKFNLSKQIIQKLKGFTR